MDQTRGGTETYLGEESWPVGLELDSGSFQDCNNLLGSHSDVIVGEDEGSVDAGEFRRHGGGAQVVLTCLREMCCRQSRLSLSMQLVTVTMEQIQINR